jgi:hypothetical protein
MAIGTLSTARRIPVIGKSIARVGQVIDIVSQPCTADPVVIVEALWHDIPTLLWSLYKPDVNDLVTERAGIKHKRKPKRRFNIFDELHGSVPIPSGKVSSVVFHLGSMAQRVGWYLLIADATTNFLVNWTSTVYEWTGCDIPGAPFCNGYGHEDYRVYHAGDWHPLPIFFNNQYQLPFLSSAGHFQCPAGYNATFSGNVRWKSVPATGFGVGQMTNVRMVDTANNLYWELPPAQLSNDGFSFTSWQIRDWTSAAPAHDFQFWAECTETGWFTFEGSFAQLTGHKDKGLIADP